MNLKGKDPGPDAFSLDTWRCGDQGRQAGMFRACPCGCDHRDGKHRYAGYLSVSNAEGLGFTLWVRDESDYQVMQKTMGGQE